MGVPLNSTKEFHYIRLSEIYMIGMSDAIPASNPIALTDVVI